MSLIAGVGDEVTEVVCVLLLLCVAALAWASTGARPNRFRTVLIMERNANSQHHHPVMLNIRRNLSRHILRGSAPPAPEDTPAGVTSTTEEELTVPADSAAEVSTGSEAQSELAGSEQVHEMDSIVDAMDADVNVVRNRRLNFFRRSNDEPSSQITTPQTVASTLPAARSGLNNIHSIIKQHAEGDTAANADCPKSPDEVQNSTESEGESKEKELTSAVRENAMHNVNIKLKYLNDTFREVDGGLEELLKDFKWRHFPTELSSNYRVLLIFNGHVLNDEASTLRTCGLYHNCVVHCLVHPPRNMHQRTTTDVTPSYLDAAAGAEHPGEGAQAQAGAGAAASEPHPWDLENVLMTFASIVLTIVWFFRCEYSNMFTASASVALFGLTIFYSVAVFGLYLSDTFQFNDNRQQPDVAPAAALPQN